MSISLKHIAQTAFDLLEKVFWRKHVINARAVWGKQFIAVGTLQDNENLMGDFGNKFDEEEWEW